MKKIGAFLLILLCVFTCVITLMGEFLYGALFGGSSQIEGTQYALTLDDNGIMYYVENVDGVNRIVKVDDLGNLIVDEELPVMTDAERFVVQSMFVTADQYIYVAGFEANLAQRTANRAIVVVLDENGSLTAMPFDKPIKETTLRLPGTSGLFSAMSEDDDQVYFAYLNEGQAAVMAHDKSDPEQVTVLNYYEVKESASALYAAPDGRILLSDAQGGLWMSAQDGSGMYQLNLPALKTFKMTRAGSTSVYYVDAVSGGIGQINYEQGTLSSICAGSMALEGGGVFADFSDVAMGARGRLAGLRYENGQYVIYAGSESRMVASPVAQRSVFNSDALIAVAILVGAMLTTVLIWDVYCSLLKMRVSVLLRQGLLTGMALTILCYVLINVIISPNLSQTLTQQVQHQVSTAARVMASNVQALDEEECVQTVQQADVVVKAADGTEIPAYLTLVRREGNALMMEATNESTLTGVSYNTVPLNADLRQAMEEALRSGETVTLFCSALGTDMVAVTSAGEDRVVIAAISAGNMDAALKGLLTTVQFFLIAVCAALFIALLLIEGLTVRSIRRLRKGVDAVSAGNYDVQIRVSSGDEVENLAHAFTSMARKIRVNTGKLTDVSSSYYRFVPENLVQLLGETSIEKVGKSSYVQKTMTVLALHFTFADESVGRNTGEMFRNINNVIESLSPVVTECGGTVYVFNSDGFIAVFERAGDALQSALRIRERAVALDENRRAQGLCAVDVRITLSSGEVMLGVIGDEKRMAPTVISDVIAVANRLSEMQKPSNVYILCTGDIIESARFYRMRRIGLYVDQERDLQLYDVYDGDPYALLKLKETIQPQFDEALKLYEAGDMVQARLQFLHIVKIAFDDGVSRNYLYCADSALSGKGQRGYRVM